MSDEAFEVALAAAATRYKALFYDALWGPSVSHPRFIQGFGLARQGCDARNLISTLFDTRRIGRTSPLGWSGNERGCIEKANAHRGGSKAGGARHVVGLNHAWQQPVHHPERQ